MDTVSRLAGGLKKLGVKKGDRVIICKNIVHKQLAWSINNVVLIMIFVVFSYIEKIDMPLIPEAVISMLATVRLGAVHSVVFGGKYYYHFKWNDFAKKFSN